MFAFPGPNGVRARMNGMRKTLLLFGATGDTGREVLNQALKEGHKVHVAEREFPSGFGEHPECIKHEADLLDGNLAHLMREVDCVISAVGLGRDPKTLMSPPPLYTEGALNMIKAMRQTGVQRLVVISAAFADPDATVPAWFKAATSPLARIFGQMADMERVIEAAEDIEWTAVRPGWLLDRPHTGTYSVSVDDLPAGTLRTRHGDLAEFMLRCAQDRLHIKEKPFIARKEDTLLETPPALIEEFVPW